MVHGAMYPTMQSIEYLRLTRDLETELFEIEMARNNIKSIVHDLQCRSLPRPKLKNEVSPKLPDRV